MEFKKEDENYVYNIIGQNVKKYRKMKKMTQAELAEKIDYSLSFISSLESKKYQTFSLGALWRISLILGIDMYKLCIDENANNKEPLFITFKCDTCDYTTEIPFEILKPIIEANKICTQKETKEITLNCKKCNGKIHSLDINNE